MSMRRRDLTDGDGEPDGGILAWATWFHLYGFATRRRNLFGQTGENGIWVPARRLAMVLLALIWLPAGIYASYILGRTLCAAGIPRWAGKIRPSSGGSS